MIKTNYEVLPQESIYTVTISLTDWDVAAKVLRFEFIGFNLKDAIKNANKKLNQFGYYLE